MCFPPFAVTSSLPSPENASELARLIEFTRTEHRKACGRDDDFLVGLQDRLPARSKREEGVVAPRLELAALQHEFAAELGIRCVLLYRDGALGAGRAGSQNEGEG